MRFLLVILAGLLAGLSLAAAQTTTRQSNRVCVHTCKDMSPAPPPNFYDGSPDTTYFTRCTWDGGMNIYHCSNPEGPIHKPYGAPYWKRLACMCAGCDVECNDPNFIDYGFTCGSGDDERLALQACNIARDSHPGTFELQ